MDHNIMHQQFHSYTSWIIVTSIFVATVTTITTATTAEASLGNDDDYYDDYNYLLSLPSSPIP